jgi:AcrR family transcriptional regulator
MPRRPPSPEKQPRTRLPSQVRRLQIMDAAARLVVEQGFLPLPTERLAREAGTSKALIYAYFPTQYDLFNALVEREWHSLATAGVVTASEVKDLEQAVTLCAMLYFEHVSRIGPLLQILTADLYMSGHENEQLTRDCESLRRRLARLIHSTLKLPLKEAAAAVEMMTAIPAEAGSLVHAKRVDAQVGQNICRTLISSSLRALHSPEPLDILAAQHGA